MDEFVNYLFKVWKLECPELIWSITGAAQNFNIMEKDRSRLKEELIKAAKTTNAWIISGGTNYGVMRLMGEAIKEDLYPNVPVIGIATWGVLASREIFLETNGNEIDYNLNDLEESETSVAINPDHTHFIFVNGGTPKIFGVEIPFRTDLEQKLRDGETKIAPMVLIVVEGGAGTIETVRNAFFFSTPIILVLVRLNN